MSFFSKLRERLDKTRTSLVGGMKRIFTGRGRVSDEVYDELEELLIEADVGVETTQQIISDMRRTAREKGIDDADALYAVLKDEMVALLDTGAKHARWTVESGPHVTLIAGVNGSGKTTTAGKFAQKLRDEGRSVLLGAADTFRAAAAEQLTIWAQRTGADIIRQQEGADPAAVAYDATDAAVARGVDNVIIDTAGAPPHQDEPYGGVEEDPARRGQAPARRAPPGAARARLPTTGQNGLQQAKIFTEALSVDGIVLTKLDGTARGGMAVAIQKQLGIPIIYIGVGEGVDDLQPFDARQFVDALFGEGGD